MKGIERQYLRECIEALGKARASLVRLSCEEAVSKSIYGKGDSLYLDAAPELSIIETLAEFDPHLQLITEEICSSVKLRDSEDEVVYFSDPMDRSKVLAQFLKDRTGIVGEVFALKQTVSEWEEANGGNVELSGPYGSITAIRHHSLLFNVMINFITGTIYVASDAGLGRLSITNIYEIDEAGVPHLKRTNHLLRHLERIEFGHTMKDKKTFLTFCEGAKYEDNLISSGIFDKVSKETILEQFLMQSNPGGPARILYLQTPPACSFILANGEKIGEWLGWLAFVKYSGSTLRAFEISFDKTWTRDQILMAPGPAYSILVNDLKDDMGKPFVNVRLNMSKLKFLENPSRYRSTLLICPESNADIIMKMRIQKRVELRFDDKDSEQTQKGTK